MARNKSLTLLKILKPHLNFQFSEQKTGGNHLAIAFHRKIEKYIDEQFIGIEQQNEKKREEFIVCDFNRYAICECFRNSLTLFISFDFISESSKYA